LATRKEYKDVDGLYRSMFENYSVDPAAGVKAELMRRVSTREFIRFNPARFNIYYLAAAVATVTTTIVLTLNAFRHDTNGTVTDSQPATHAVEQQLLQKGETAAPEAGCPAESALAGKPVAEKDNPAITPDKGTAGRNEVSDPAGAVIPVETGRGVQPAREVRITGMQDAGITANKPVSSFAASSLSGCAPFTVMIHSTSSNHDTLQWLSGDGRTSGEKDIEWTYTEPGTYTVVLVAMSSDGRKDQSSADITVYPLPSARFDVSPANIDLNDREVMLYNYSTGMLTSTWDFGDGETSQLREPVHLYKSGGQFRIKLTVSNEFGCTDTVSRVYATSTGSHNIVFPNAFIPNKNGSTGGYYSPRSDEAAFVFHPEYEGVSEYHLIIYSRTGAVIFESRNLNIGWDGYYRGQLCEPGVYIWRARGRYANGEQFIKMGDVTLLRF
jgi:PKD repeat protein